MWEVGVSLGKHVAVEKEHPVTDFQGYLRVLQDEGYQFGVAGVVNIEAGSGVRSA